MKDTDNLDTIRQWPVKNDIPPQRKASDVLFQFRASTPDPGPRRQNQKLFMNLGNKGIRPRFAVLRDIVPNLDQIRFCAL